MGFMQLLNASVVPLANLYQAALAIFVAGFLIRLMAVSLG